MKFGTLPISKKYFDKYIENGNLTPDKIGSVPMNDFNELKSTVDLLGNPQFQDYTGEIEIPKPDEAIEKIISRKPIGIILQYINAALRGIYTMTQKGINIALGKNQARVFPNVSDLDNWLSIPENTDKLNIGDNFYIIATDVPDYWWDGNQKQRLETQKVDLTTYDQTITELQSDVTRINNDLSGKLQKSILDKCYPVGSIYMSVNNVNPGTIFGGTWERWGNGKAVIGVDENDGNFNTVGKTGGVKVVNLNHSHSVNGHVHSTGNHVITVAEMPGHTHKLAGDGSAVIIGGSVYNSTLHDNGFNAYSGGWWNHTNKSTGGIESTGGGSAHNHGNTGSAGSTTDAQLSTAVNNMPPYITCYMWKRTA